jgi:hypothetical protein
MNHLKNEHWYQPNEFSKKVGYFFGNIRGGTAKAGVSEPSKK